MKKMFISLMIGLMMFGVVGCGGGTTESVAPEEVIVETSPKEENKNVSNKEIIVADTENYTFKIKGSEYDEFWEAWNIKVYLENKTNENMMFSWEDVSVNGYMIDPFWASEVAPNKKENTTISFYESDFIENDIETVENVSFRLNIYNENPDTWEVTKEHLNDTFTVSFK